MASYTFTSDNQYLINAAPGVNGPDGIVCSFVISGTNSGVLKVNTAPPGSAVSLSSVPYLNASLALQSAGTAITATGLAYVSAADAARGDLYLDLNWTSGSVVVDVATASIGGGGSSGGTVPAADVTAGTFGANAGETGDYTFPDDVVVNDDADVVGDLTAGTIASDAGVSGTSLTYTTLLSSTTALATPSALAATAHNTFASTVSGGVLMGFGTTHDATLKNRAGTSVLGVTANTSDVTAAGALAVTGVLSNAATTATLAQSASTATVSVGTGTGSGNSAAQVRGAAGTTRFLRLTTGATTARWDLSANSTAESGANAGSNFLISAYDDAGSAIDDPMSIARVASGAITFAANRPVTLGSIVANDSSLGITGEAAAQGGAIVVTGGTSSTGGNAGGAVSIVGGTPGSTGVGGAANVTAAAGGSASGKGGAANVTAGAGTAGNASGGSVVLQPGAKNGTGLDGGTFDRGTFRFVKMPTPATATDSASLTDAQMTAGVIVATPTAAAAYTVRTGTQLLAALPTDIVADDAFDLTIINIGGTGDDITLTAATDITIVGDPVVRPSADSGTEEAGQGTFRFRYTGTTVFIAYRIA